MQINSLSPDTRPLLNASEGADRSAESFEQTLRNLPKAPKHDIREAAEQLVATTFIQPILAKAREDPFKVERFHGGQGEKIFGGQLDTILADRIVKKSNFPLVDRIAEQFGQRNAEAAYAPVTSNAPRLAALRNP